MKPINIPVLAIGPGSQPAQELELDYLPLPAAETFRMPLPPENAALDDAAASADAVEKLIEAMRGYRFGERNYPRFSLADMRENARRVLNESLGQGEVSAIVRSSNGGSGWHIQETAFAGVWRVQRDGPDGELAEDWVEACDMPEAVVSCARSAALPRFDPGRLPEGVMNAPALLREIQHQASVFRPGRGPHVVNLSMLPLTPADYAAINALLGEGRVAILSRGFGNCHISSTQVRGVWRVQYFNSMNTPILDTIEVVDIPEAARAAAEDFSDSIGRLQELLVWLREG